MAINKYSALIGSSLKAIPAYYLARDARVLLHNEPGKSLLVFSCLISRTTPVVQFRV